MQILRREKKSDDYNHQISGTKQRERVNGGCRGGEKQQQQIEFLFGYDKMHYVFLKSLKVCLGFSSPSVPIAADANGKKKKKTKEWKMKR